MELTKLLLPLRATSTQIVRAYGKHNKKYLYDNGVKQNNIYYYPRTAGQTEAPPSGPPPKFFRVQRIKPVKGNPYWDKKLLKELGLDGRQSDFTVVKNIPEINARLWKIKHLVDVQPITFPDGEPTEENMKSAYIKENGECIVGQNFAGALEERWAAQEEFEKDPKRLDTELLRRDARLKWLNPLQ